MTHGDGSSRQISDDGRWEWDGSQWQPRAQTGQTPPPPSQPTYQQPQQPVYPTQPAPPKKKHTLRNVLIAIIVIILLMIAGCMALIGGVANEVDKAIKENDNRAGGTNNPLTIREGEPFEVDGFNYAGGWTVGKEFGGFVAVKGLKVTNNREDRDSALVEIKFWRGSEVLALTDCTTEPIAPKTTVTVTCSSSDKLPSNYSKITINDTF